MNVYDAGSLLHPPPKLASFFELNAPASFFLLPEWFWLIDQFGAEGRSHVHLWMDDTLNVALPLLQTEESQTLQSCTNLYTCEFDILGHSDQRDQVGKLAKECATESGCNYIRLEGISANSSSLAELQRGFKDAGFVSKPYFGWGTWFEDTTGLAFAEYVDRRPAILRNTWKRKSESLSKSADWEIQVLEPGEDVTPFFSAYEKVHAASWKQPEPYPEFLRHAVDVAARRGALRMGLLTIDHVPAAAQFWFVWSGRAIIFKLAYDSRFSRFSPGTVLTMHMIQSVLERDGPREITFGRGDDAYKKLWLSQRREHWGIEAANPRTPTGFLKAVALRSALYRDALRSRLGPYKQKNPSG